MGFAPAGSGEHDFLWVEKEGVNTAWVAEILARHAGVRDVDVGYAGRKDRNALTRQWFSVRRPAASGTNWQSLAEPGVFIRDVDRHEKKLRRGVHQGNRFRIAIRDIDACQAEIEPWLTIIRDSGVPNYFGPQRFGRQGSNILLAQELFSGKRMRRNKRSIAISAARSYVFNDILQSRIEQGVWDRAAAGDAFNLDGSNSIFVADDISAEIVARLKCFDIHPTAALWGKGEPACRGAARDIENGHRDNELCKGLEKQGAEQARRPTRLIVRDLDSAMDKNTLQLNFTLMKGGYATAVLRELVV